MRTVGIDIGSFSIKVAEAESHSRNASIRDFYEIELNHDPSHDLRLDKIDALRRIFSHYDPRKYKTVIGIGSEFSSQRILTFPFLERKKILQSLPFELEDAIPFSQEEAVFDFRIIHQRGKSSQVLAVAVPKKYVQEVLTLCEDAGVDPDLISLDGIAVANLFEDYLGPVKTFNSDTQVTGPSELLIHIGYGKTLVNILKDRTLVSSRAIYFGGRDLTNLVSRAYQLPYFEALKGVAEKSFILTESAGADDDQVAFSNVIRQGLNVLVSEIKRTLVDTRAEMDLQITQGYLTGGMSRLINLGPYLSRELEIPIGVYDQIGKNYESDIAATPENEKASPVAVGLALEACRKPKNPPINLRKNEFSKQSQNLKYLWEQYQGLAKTAALLFFIFCVYSFFKLSFAEDNLAAIDKALRDQTKNPTLNITSAQLKPDALRKFVKAKRQEIEGKKQVIKYNKMTSALDVLRSISAATPQKNQITLDVRKLVVEDENVLIEGLVNSKAEYDLFQRSLRQVPGAGALRAGQPVQQASGKMAFQIAFSVQRLPPGAR